MPARLPVSTTAAGDHPQPNNRQWGVSEPVAALILLAPMLLFFCVSVAYPFFNTIWLSFFDIRGLGGAKWAGFGNYARLFRDPSFQSAMATTLHWTLATTAISVGIGWGLAVMCSMAPRATAVFRIMFFATYGVSEVVSGFIWLGILRPGEAGLVNALLSALGLQGWMQPWLGNPHTAIWAVILAYAWTQVGLPLLTCYAAVRSIPNSILEAAYIDGAKPLSMMRHIIFPLSFTGLRVALFINLLAALRAFDMIFVLTAGGPARATETMGFFVYREAMTQFKLGYGAAATVILLICVLLVSVPAILQRTREVR